MRKYIYHILQLITLLHFIGVKLFGQNSYIPVFTDKITESWRWTNISFVNGKSVQCIAQGIDGSIWFGVDKGVQHYDGYKWTLFQKPDSIKDITISTLLSTSKHKLFVGTDKGLFLLQDTVWSNFFENDVQVNVSDITKLNDGSVLLAIGNRSSDNKLAGLLHINGNKYIFYASKSTYNRYHKEFSSKYNWKIVPDDFCITSTHGEYVFNVLDVCSGNSGKIYVGITDNQNMGKLAVFRLDITDNTVLTINRLYTEKDGLKFRSAIQIAETLNEEVWIVSNAYDFGLNIIKNGECKIENLAEKFGGVNCQNSILVCSDGSIWIDGHGRFFHYNKGKWKLYEQPDIPLSTASRYQFYELNDKNIWIVSRLGEVYRFNNTYDDWITYGNLNYQCDSEDGISWFLNSEGKCVIQNFGQWYSYDTKHGLIDTPVRLFITKAKTVWAVGSHNGIAASAWFDGKEWHKTLYPKLSWGIDSRAVFQSYDSTLWFGSSVDIQIWKNQRGGVIAYNDPEKDKKTYVQYPTEDNVRISTCYGIGQSKDNRIWFAGQPQYIFEDGKISEFNEIQKLQKYVDCMHTDSEGNLWMGSRFYGVFLYDGINWKNYTTEDGLPSNGIISIFAENKSNIWVATHRGICHFDGQTWSSGIFSSQLTMTNEGGAIMKSNSGHLWFNYSTKDWKRRGLTGESTSENAYTNFRTIRYLPDNNAPETQITVYNKEVDVNGNTTVFWSASDYFEVTPLDEIQYSWRLNSGDWSTFSNHNYHYFSNLSPGDYTLEVRSRDHEFNIDKTPDQISFVVLPPWWKRPQFLSMALFSICIIMVLLYKLTKHYFRLQSLNIELENKSTQLQEQKQEIEMQNDKLSETVVKIQNLSQSRLRFFTNVSHEFRTPLSLILGPVDELLDKIDISSKNNKYLQIIQRNANRLLRLINQILEVYKVEESTLEFSPVKADFIAPIREIVGLFDSLAEKHSVDLKVDSNVEKIVFSFDQDKIEKILFNLLSNAFKNISIHGRIHVSVALVANDNLASNKIKSEKYVQLVVGDNGKGIPKEHLEKIFERFYQESSDDSSSFQMGTGIGLSYITDLVKTHQGTISVSSDPGISTSFTVCIPFITGIKAKENKTIVKGDRIISDNIHEAVAELARTLEETNEENNSYQSLENKGASSIKLLIVDDDLDTRVFLRNCFNTLYSISEAENGIEGLKVARLENPDLIISDIMMPEMDGIQFCRVIKSDFETSHIPVVLLTAKTLTEDKIKGFETGADAYIEKPFNSRVLKSRVQNMIQSRNKLRKRFQTDINIKPIEMEIASLDEKFIQNAISTVESYLDDPVLDAEKLARELSVSRIQLYRKLKALTGQTVNQFIKSIRLKHSARLLLNKEKTVSEIAYECGFSAPNHFATYFKQQFGCSPTDYIEKSGKV